MSSLEQPIPARAAVASPTPQATPHSAASPKTGGLQTADILRAFAIDSVIHERYEVKSHLGRGGHATVLRVFDRELSEDCALKVFHNTGDAGDVARFKREVSISRKIVHENVVTLYDIGQESGFYYLTMELLTGDDLSTTLKKRAITLGDAIAWLVDACRGLQAAHDKGVVHRDVKPGNLFVLNTGRLKVMDFGIAKPADALSLTSTGVFVGTPQFVSPEQVQGKDVGPAADIYSLGIVAYLMFTGSLPFREKEMVALLMKHATGTPERPIARNPALPQALDELVFAMLKKLPSQRPKSCADVADALDKIRRSLA
jgi:serine/threonine protein kinase